MPFILTLAGVCSGESLLVLEARRESQWEFTQGVYRRPREWGRGGEAASVVLVQPKGQL